MSQRVGGRPACTGFSESKRSTSEARPGSLQTHAKRPDTFMATQPGGKSLLVNNPLFSVESPLPNTHTCWRRNLRRHPDEPSCGVCNMRSCAQVASTGTWQGEIFCPLGQRLPTSTCCQAAGFMQYRNEGGGGVQVETPASCYRRILAQRIFPPQKTPLQCQYQLQWVWLLPGF